MFSYIEVEHWKEKKYIFSDIKKIINNYSNNWTDFSKIRKVITDLMFLVDEEIQVHSLLNLQRENLPRQTNKHYSLMVKGYISVNHHI